MDSTSSFAPPSTKQAPDITMFLSYHRSQEAFARRLTVDLAPKQVLVRADWLLSAGEDWWDRVTTLVREANVFAFLLTPESIHSPVCLRELELAQSLKKIILPVIRVRPAEEDLAQLVEVLATRQWLFFREGDDTELALEKLAEAARTDFELAVLHTRLTVSSDVWERRAGDLLRGRYLREAEQALGRMEKRAPLLPAATASMGLYVAQSRAAQRRRIVRNTLLAVVTLVFTALLGWIAWQQRKLKAQATAQAEIQRRNAHLQELERQSDSALTAVRNGQVPAAVGLLDAVVKNDPGGDEPSSHLLHRYLRSLLMTREEVLSTVPASSVFRWRGTDYALRADRTLMPLSGNAAIQFYALASRGRYLVTADVLRNLCVFDLKAQTDGHCSNLGMSVPKKVFEQPSTGSLAIPSQELILTEDEDSHDAQAAGDPKLFVLKTPLASPESGDAAAQLTQACAAGGSGLCGFVQISDWSKPNVLSVDFPRLRPEASYWEQVAASPPDLPREWQIGTTQLAAETDARKNRLDFDGAHYGTGVGIPVQEPYLPAASLFDLRGSHYVLVQSVIGKQSVGVYICRLRQGEKAESCESSSMTARSQMRLSPAAKQLLIWSPEVQDQSFQVMPVPAMTPCPGIPGPGERALTTAFTPDGNFFAVLSRDGEIWVYSAGEGCHVKLEERVFNDRVAVWSAAQEPELKLQVGLTLLGEGQVLITHLDEDVIALDTKSRLLQWSRSFAHTREAHPWSFLASPDKTLLAAWNTDSVELIDAATGVSLSSTVAPLLPPSSTPGKVSRIMWRDGAPLAEIEGGTSSRRVLLRRLTPPEAEAKFLHGAPTCSLLELNGSAACQ